jgi:hypothetical protein
MYNAIISTQVRDENEYLDEWVRYHLGIGFDHIVIYDNESIIPVNNLWGDKVTVLKESREFQSSESDNCHNDTVRNFPANWIARIDVDEFIVVKNINEFLEHYKEFGGVGINWRIFGTSGHIQKPEGLVKDNYIWRMPDNCGWILNGGSYHLKTIIRREFCLQVHHPHFCLSSRPLVNEDYVPYPDAWTDSSRKKAVIHHYVTKSKEEWTAKYDLWRYKYGLRTENELTDIDKNCIIFDKTLVMNEEMNYQWATHQPLIQGVLKLYEPKFILELGTGYNSTPLFQGYGYIGVENDLEWIKEIHKKYYMQIIHHDLDRQTVSLEDYYKAISLPNEFPRLLFVDNYESCRLIAINALRDRFDLIIFHDCEPEPGARVNHYDMIDSAGFSVYFLKTPSNWTGLMVRHDKGFDELLKSVNPYIDEFKQKHPEMEWMRLANLYIE